MGKKKIALILVIAFSMVAFFSLTASAERAWYVCTVYQVGPAGTDNVVIWLSDTEGSFDNVSFAAREGAENRILAAALLAIGNGMKVKVNIDPNAPPAERTISGIYIRW